MRHACARGLSASPSVNWTCFSSHRNKINCKSHVPLRVGKAQNVPSQHRRPPNKGTDWVSRRAPPVSRCRNRSGAGPATVQIQIFGSSRALDSAPQRALMVAAAAGPLPFTSRLCDLHPHSKRERPGARGRRSHHLATWEGHLRGPQCPWGSHLPVSPG